MLPRHTVTAPWLWKLLCGLLRGGSIKAAAEAISAPFGLETLYHLLQRLRRRLADLRSLLCREQAAPASSQSDPLHQTTEHLQSVFSTAHCAPAEVQRRFQRPLLG